MKYHVTFSCGHEGEVSLWVGRDLLEAKLRYYQNKGICPKCQKLKVYKERKKSANKDSEKEKEQTKCQENS